MVAKGAAYAQGFCLGVFKSDVMLSMSRLIVVFLAATFFMPSPAYAHQWCLGADGAYAEDLILRLQSNQSTGKDRAALDRIVASLQVWLTANEQIGKTAGFKERLFICNLPNINAFVTTKNEPVRVHFDTVIILDAFGADEDVIAVLLGHEYAHLALNHNAQEIAAKKTIMRRAERTYQNVLQRTWDSREAVDVAITGIKSELSAFSIKQELEADDFGISLLAKSGYKPTAFTTLHSVAMGLYGDGNTNPFPSHPGFVERMTKGDTRVSDESYDQTAAALMADGKTDRTSALVSEWMSRLPNSGNAWYYKAILLKQKENPEALEAMEESLLPSRKPSRSQRTEVANEANLWLCVQLFREGFIVESATCGDMLLNSGTELWSQFMSQTFVERLWVNSTIGRSNIDRPPLHLNFIRKPDGTKLIVNSTWMADNYGVFSNQDNSSWRPIRFKSCEATEEKPCPSP